MTKITSTLHWVLKQKERTDRLPNNEIAWRMYTRYRDSYILETLAAIMEKLEFLENEVERNRIFERAEGEMNKRPYQ